MNKKTEIKRAFYAAFPNTVPILTGFLVLGMAYGVLMQVKGYGTLWSVLMSVLAFCGSMQFVAITLLTGVFNPIQAFLLSLMVNARHLFYGISMLNKFKGLGKIKYFLIFTLCDETFSIESSVKVPENINKKYFYFAISLLDYLYWITGTFLGSVIGKFIEFNTNGLDFALTALFIVLFVKQIKDSKKVFPGAIGFFASAAALLLFGADNFVIPAMVFIMAILLIKNITDKKSSLSENKLSNHSE